MKVRNIIGSTGRAVANQFIITDNQAEYFQSYNSIIVKRYFPNMNAQKQYIQLDERYWDYSTTTGKYRNQFLCETKRETEKKIKSGEYILTNLN